METFLVHTDGGARGNPGPAGIGVAIYDASGTVVAELSEYLGEATNNVAEYTAIVRALETLQTLANDPAQTSVTIKLDSQLAERQLNGVYRVKDITLKTYFDRAKALIEAFQSVTFVHVLRAENKAADQLANGAMDRGA